MVECGKGVAEDDEIPFSALLRWFGWLARQFTRETRDCLQIGGPHNFQPQPMDCG